MEISIQHNNVDYVANLMDSLDISVPIATNGIVAWDMPQATIKPVKNGDWVGDVNRGGAVNFNSINFNPHAHGTHTECVGHISSKQESINQELSEFFFISKLITVCPEKNQGDDVISQKMLLPLINKNDNVDALIIRTNPNKSEKIGKNYSQKNPA